MQKHGEAQNGTPLIANANDIVEYDGTRWNVVFNSSLDSTVQYVTNTNYSVFNIDGQLVNGLRVMKDYTLKVNGV
jgi:hypothetical protein